MYGVNNSSASAIGVFTSRPMMIAVGSRKNESACRIGVTRM